MDEGARQVVLVGGMGAGKSTVGRLVADQLGWPLVDSDEQILAATGHTVDELARRRGIDAVHRLERSMLAEALLSGEPSVVAAAASVVDAAEGLRLLQRAQLVVWLRVDPAEEVARITTDASTHRPTSELGPAEVRALLRERSTRYRAVADLVIDTDTIDPRATAVRIVSEVA